MSFCTCFRKYTHKYIATFCNHLAELLTKSLWCDISKESAGEGWESAALTSSCELWALSFVPVGEFHIVAKGRFSAMNVTQAVPAPSFSHQTLSSALHHSSTCGRPAFSLLHTRQTSQTFLSALEGCFLVYLIRVPLHLFTIGMDI